MKINWIMLMWEWLSEMVSVVYPNISHEPQRTLRKCYTCIRVQGVFSPSYCMTLDADDLSFLLDLFNGASAQDPT